ncbi:sigma-E factor negative regulatory protein [Glaciimonas soli]|uniref:Histidine kinase n=1 Tax=Glaciimonas soli TaxID=2590999 RepID=A0A843YUM4_9BURK|nr:sigma-E factor negative regulatory protein [Glaciimonas soli]MQR01697.1 histidine kinase [Glaciimonas soli]
MNTKEISQEQISALADGELSNTYVDSALAALRQTENRLSWDVYHQIGDVLRSDDMAFNLSTDFTSKLMARLESESAIIAAPRVIAQSDAVHQVVANGSTAAVDRHIMRRFGLPGMAAAAAVAAVTFIALPQMRGDRQSFSPTAVSQLAMASTPNTGATSAQMLAASRASHPEVLRDPGIDEYLLAHQRFSPALYSTAQYARSATYAPDADN